MGFADTTATLASHLEAKLAQESGGAVGHVLPVPKSPKKSTAESRKDADVGILDPLEALGKDIGAARGGTILSETLASGWGDKDNAVKTQYKPTRFGADPPCVLQVLRSDVGQSLLAACGCPIDLFMGSGSGQAARAAWQRFISGSGAGRGRPGMRRAEQKAGRA